VLLHFVIKRLIKAILAKKIEMIGIVLIGGQSKRMGKPKACIEFKGEKMAMRTAKLLKQVTPEVYFSGRKEQKPLVEDIPVPFIEDRYTNRGPIAGILSAFEYTNTKTALLFTATDMPFLDIQTLQKLLEFRNPEKALTIYKNRETGYLETLCAIYEPKAYERIRHFMEKEIYAIHRMFNEEELEQVNLPENKALTNINYPEQLGDLELD
jgi:molybdopterin-guanine dinucleotide biosynthesis protein A